MIMHALCVSGPRIEVKRQALTSGSLSWSRSGVQDVSCNLELGYGGEAERDTEKQVHVASYKISVDKVVHQIASYTDRIV